MREREVVPHDEPVAMMPLCAPCNIHGSGDDYIRVSSHARSGGSLAGARIGSFVDVFMFRHDDEADANRALDLARGWQREMGGSKIAELAVWGKRIPQDRSGFNRAALPPWPRFRALPLIGISPPEHSVSDGTAQAQLPRGVE